MSMEKAEPEPIDSTVSTGGRVVIPEPIRWYFGISEGDQVSFSIEGEKVVLDTQDEK